MKKNSKNDNKDIIINISISNNIISNGNNNNKIIILIIIMIKYL